MALTATGIGSGLDISSIVGVLVDAEKTPKEALFTETETKIDAKVSAIGTLKSALSTFQDAAEKLQSGEFLNIRTVSTGDSDFFTATADQYSQPGSYSIIVEQLALSQKLAGATVSDATAGVGEGSLDFSVNGESFSVAITDTDNLAAIASKINNASDNSGVTATVIKSDSGSRLVFTSTETGTDNQMTVTATDTTGTGLSDMFSGTNLESLQEAQDSIIYVDGQKLTSQSNTIDDAITGVELSLTDADVGETSTLTIAQDTESVKTNIESFVSAYNALITSMDTLSSFDVEEDTAAALQGDSMIRSLESQLRKMVSERVSVDGVESALYELGISTDRDGKLSIDDDKLSDAVTNNMSLVEGVFSTSDTGLAYQFDDLVESYTKTGGIIDARNNTYTSQTSRLADQREAFTLKMEQLEARLLKQFNAMDLVVSELNSQGSSLTSSLASLPGVISS
ncbi:flagellar filament capping protein FliD [Shewanella phaeophyticola]|uniref:Flagellar hook-associated protein 2 n=1 Tax=Shewanella phaeophyticola TaxID=2978345 RepID=A0ABT2P6G3_9GAMM|nr:flagellar filament capping protein FliD [Shewanella sp. KJ10-1]MCT8987230.1 flagellar filament capping protein FliD [Shewanella sp. KJ10-1]